MPPLLTTARPDVPPALAELITQLLAEKPADRPPSARTVEESLVRIEQDLGAARMERGV